MRGLRQGASAVIIQPKQGRSPLYVQEMPGRKTQEGNHGETSAQMGGVKYSDPEFDGKTPREVMDVLSRAAKWLNSYGGYTCNISLRYEKEIKLPID